MTCIVALKTETGVVMGADSLTTLDSTKLVNITNESKLLKFPNFTIGISGDGPIRDVLEFILDTDPLDDDYSWVDHELNSRHDCTNFITHFIDKFQERVPEANNEDLKYEFLMTNGKNIWWVINGPSVFEIEKFWAAGSGSSYAIGALSHLQDVPAKEAVEAAIKTACKYDNFCQEPIEVIVYE